MEEHPHADIIEDIAMALSKDIHTIPDLAKKINADPTLITSLLENEFIQGQFAEKKVENGVSNYYLTQKGKSDANFIAIGRGEYKIELIDLEDHELMLIHKYILLLLENTTKEKPIILYGEFFKKHPELKTPYPQWKTTIRQFTWRVGQLESGGYIENDLQSGYYITVRGKELLDKIRTRIF